MTIMNWVKNLFGIAEPVVHSGMIAQSTGQYVEDTNPGKLYLLFQKQCPDCRRKPPVWLEGPSGGMSTNIFCAACGAGFNVAPIVGIAERIGVNEKYILSEEKIKELE